MIFIELDKVIVFEVQRGKLLFEKIKLIIINFLEEKEIFIGYVFDYYKEYKILVIQELK